MRIGDSGTRAEEINPQSPVKDWGGTSWSGGARPTRKRRSKKVSAEPVSLVVTAPYLVMTKDLSHCAPAFL
jgi:hypothetical protein